MGWTIRPVAAALCLTLGCGGTEPIVDVVLTMQNISGTYVGVTFTTEENGEVTDQLRRGAAIELTLIADGTTAGQLEIPPDASGCCGLDVSLVGTWTLNGDVVTLSHNNESFLNGIPLVFEETHLSGETTRDGVTYRVVLAW